MKIQSSELFPSAFNNDFRAIINHDFTYYCEAGGRGSCKSSFISIALVTLLLSHENANALVLRKVFNTLRDSVYSQLVWAIEKLQVAHLFRFTKSPLEMVKIDTGQKIIFRGADEPVRIKSIKLERGYFALTWFEELSEFTQNDVHTITLSTMRGGNQFWVFYSYNPPASPRHWCNVEFQKVQKNRLVHFSDFRAVPALWLGEPFLQSARDMKKHNERAYKNIFLGEATGSGSLVFENIECRKITDAEKNNFEFIYHGVDFGYFPDPFCYVAMSYNAKTKTLFIFGELYLYKHSNFDAYKRLCDYMQALDFSIGDERITADSAEPKSIADFREYGANMRGAIKGRGSLDAGMKWLQGLKKIVIDNECAPKCANEFSLYEYDIDKKSGEVLEGFPQGQSDHAIAAVRYALESVWMKRGA